MADKSRVHKGDKGILGYDPKKARPTPKQLKCAYCLFSHHAQSQLTKHVNANHWDEVKEQ